jgi:hypothetical protein
MLRNCDSTLRTRSKLRRGISLVIGASVLTLLTADNLLAKHRRHRDRRCWCCTCDDNGFTIPGDYLGAIDKTARVEIEALLRSEVTTRESALRVANGQKQKAQAESASADTSLKDGKEEEATAVTTVLGNETVLKDATNDAVTHSTANDTANRFLKEKADQVESAFTLISAGIDNARAIATAELQRRKDVEQAARKLETTYTEARNIASTAFENAKRDLTTKVALRVSAGDLERAAKEEVDRVQNVVNEASDALDSLVKSIKNLAQGKVDKARQDLKDARDALKAANYTLTERRGALKLAEDAARGAQDLFDKADDTLRKAASDVQGAATKVADAVMDVNVQRQLCRLRDRTVEEWKQSSKEWLDFIEMVGTEGEKAALQVVRDFHHASEAARTAANELEQATVEAGRAVSRLEKSREVQIIKKQAVVARQQIAAQADRTKAVVESEALKAAKAVKDAINALTAEEIIPFQIDSWVTFSANCYTGGIYANIALDFAGLSMDSEKLKGMLQGTVAIPSFNPIQLAASCTGLKLTFKDQSYFQARSEVMGGPPINTTTPTTNSVAYFSSKRFTDWAEGGAAVRLAAQSITDGGQGAIAEIKQQLLLEYQEILAWFKLQGQELTDDMAVEMIFAIIQGRQPSLPSVTFRPQVVNYPFELEANGTSFLPKPLRDRADKAFGTVTQRLSAAAKTREAKALTDHLGFVITINNLPPQQFDSRIASFDGLFGKGRDLARAGATRVFGALASRIPEAKLQSIIRELVTALQQGSVDDSYLMQVLAPMLPVKGADIQKYYVPGQRIVNLAETPFSKQAEEIFRRCALGNRGSAKVEQMDLDLVTMTLSTKVLVHHCHSWGKLKDLIGGL